MKTVDNILRGMRRLADEAERGDCYDLVDSTRWNKVVLKPHGKGGAK